MLTEIFLQGIKNIKDIEVLRGEGNYSAVVSFNKDGMNSIDLAEKFSGRGILLRGGYQCAALAHKFLKTEKSGTVRFSPSVMNKPEDVRRLVRELSSIK